MQQTKSVQSVQSSAKDLFAQVLDPANRHNPYPIYEQMRKTPVAQIDEHYYAVTSYPEILSVLHDPGVSKEQQKSSIPVEHLRNRAKQWILFLDPPEHDKLRRLIMDQLTPARVNGLHQFVDETVTELLDAQQNQQQFDLVDAFSYPLPVSVICKLLGVPREDVYRFHEWVDLLTEGLDPNQSSDPRINQAFQAISAYMAHFIEQRRSHPQDDMVSKLAIGDDPAGKMDDETLISTTIMLLLAGHETTVNLITNSMLTLLRYTEEWQKLQQNPARVTLLVEEVLRYEPPVQMASRFALTDMQLRGVTIPKGAGIRLILAAGSRDPQRFDHPNTFDPERTNNQHFGFGNGIHYCVGAPLARLETHIALTALARRLMQPRLVIDPPPYRENSTLRGPLHLPIAFDHMEKASTSMASTL